MLTVPSGIEVAVPSARMSSIPVHDHATVVGVVTYENPPFHVGGTDPFARNCDCDGFVSAIVPGGSNAAEIRFSAS